MSGPSLNTSFPNRRFFVIANWCLILLLCSPALAQTNAPKSGAGLLTDEYPVAFGGDDQDYAEGVAVDGDGNTYVVGRFKETVDFDPGPGTAEHVSFGSDDAFLASYDEDGAFRYVVAIGAPGQDFATAVAVDADGNAFVTGRLVGTADFDPDPVATHNLTGDGDGGFDGDVFVASYDSEGALRFAFLIDSSFDSEGQGVSVDAAGNVYVVGRVYGGATNFVEFNPDPAGISIRGFSASAGFIAGYDNMGAYRFAERIGGDENGLVSAYAIHTDDSGMSHVAGSYSGTVDFDPESGEEEVRTSTGNGSGGNSRDVFIASYDESGDLLQVLTFGGPGTDRAGAVAVGASGTMYVAGTFTDTADFDPGAGMENRSSVDGSTDGFLASYDASGAFRFAHAIGAESFDEVYGVGLDADGNAYVSGEFNGTVDFDPDPVGTAERTVNVFDDVFVASYTENGAFRYVSVVGGPGRDEGLAIDVYPNGMSAVAGRFAETVDFDPDDGDTAFRTAEDMAGSFGNGDVFVAKYDVDGSLVRGYEPPEGCDIAVRNTADSGEGSLRQAITDANGAVGAETICFDISGDGPHTIQPLSELPEVTDPVTIDGLTQPGAACAAWPPTLMIELDGSLAGPGADGLRITAGGSTVKGLVVNRFGSDGIDLQIGGGNTIACNFLGTDITGTLDRGNGNGDGVDVKSPNNIVGYADGVMGNLASGSNNQGIRVAGEDAVGNIVRGNRVGTDVSGTVALGNTFAGIIIDGASETTIGGTEAGDGNLISGNQLNGIEVQETGFLSNNSILGNYIGTDITGQAALGNEVDGILLDRAAYTTIGGSEPAAGNVISGNGDDGVDIFGDGSDSNTIRNNAIGVAADGVTPLGNVEDGIDLNDGPSSNHVADNVLSSNGEWGLYINSGTSDTQVYRNYVGTNAAGDDLGNGFGGILVEDSGPQIIGGTYGDAGECCEGNTIAYNDGPGIGVDVLVSISHEKGLRGNRIFSNDGLGIDLELDGVTDNDPGDADGAGAANALQNYPVLDVPPSGVTQLTGTLNSVPSSSFLVDVYRSSVCDPSGYGEGEVFLGTVSVETDASGNAPITFDLDVQTGPGEFYTATAIDAQANTSEFSACVEPDPPVDTPPSASEIMAPADGATVTVGGTGPDDAADPNDTIAVSWTASVDPEGADVTHTWQLSASDSFAELLLEVDAGADTQIAFTLAELAAVLDGAGVDVGAGISVYHRVISTDGTNETVGPVAEATLIRGTLIGEVDMPPSASEITAPADGATVVVGGTGQDDAGDPNATIEVGWTVSIDPEGADVMHTWQLSASDSFSEMLLEVDAASDTEITFTLAELAAVLDAEGIALGTGVSAYHRVISSDGTNETSGPAAEVTLVRGTITSTGTAGETPAAYVLRAAYPNPFNPSTTIGYALPESGQVRLGVFDLLGREVRVLVDGVRPAGDHRAVFEAGALPSGIYLIRMEAGGKALTRQVTLMK